MPERTLLLVDTDARSLRVLEVSLKKAGFSVVTANSAGETLALALKLHPDLLLTETSLPDADGFELARRIKANPRTSRTLVLFLSQDASAAAKVRGIEAGGDDFLAKPVLVMEVLARVRGLLERRATEAITRPDRQGNISGALSSMGVVDILQLVETGKKTGIAYIADAEGEQRGALHFRDGRVIDAHVGNLCGSSAVYRLLAWDQGLFELELRPLAREDVVCTSTQSLLLEGMRRIDEQARLRELLPPLSARLGIDERVHAASADSLTSDEKAVLALVDGQRTIAKLLVDASLDDLAVLQALVDLTEKHVVYTVEREVLTGSPETSAIEAWLSAPGVFASSRGEVRSIPSALGRAMIPSRETPSEITRFAEARSYLDPIASGEPFAHGQRALELAALRVQEHTPLPEPLAEDAPLLSRHTVPAKRRAIGEDTHPASEPTPLTQSSRGPKLSVYRVNASAPPRSARTPATTTDAESRKSDSISPHPTSKENGSPATLPLSRRPRSGDGSSDAALVEQNLDALLSNAAFLTTHTAAASRAPQPVAKEVQEPSAEELDTQVELEPQPTQDRGTTVPRGEVAAVFPSDRSTTAPRGEIESVVPSDRSATARREEIMHSAPTRRSITAPRAQAPSLEPIDRTVTAPRGQAPSLEPIDRTVTAPRGQAPSLEPIDRTVTAPRGQAPSLEAVDQDIATPRSSSHPTHRQVEDLSQASPTSERHDTSPRGLPRAPDRGDTLPPTGQRDPEPAGADPLNDSFFTRAAEDDGSFEKSRGSAWKGLVLVGSMMLAFAGVVVVPRLFPQRIVKQTANPAEAPSSPSPAPAAIAPPTEASPTPPATANRENAGAETRAPAPAEAKAPAPAEAKAPAPAEAKAPAPAEAKAPVAKATLSAGEALLQQEKFREAEKQFRAVLEADPKSAKGHSGLALVLYNLERDSLAQAEASSALALDPSEGRAHLVLGLVASNKQDYPAAKRAYERYLELEPKGAWAEEVRRFLKAQH